MIRVIGLTILLCISITAFSQKTDSLTKANKITNLYGYIGRDMPFINIEALTHSGLILVINNKYGASFSYAKKNVNAKEKPNDFIGQISGWGGGRSRPMDYMQPISLRLVREFNPLSTRFLRFGVEAGPSFVTYSRTKFTPNPNYNSTSFESNYKKSFEKKYSVGLNSRLKIELPLLKYVGLQFGVSSDLNPYLSYLVYDVNFTFGLVR